MSEYYVQKPRKCDGDNTIARARAPRASAVLLNLLQFCLLANYYDNWLNAGDN